MNRHSIRYNVEPNCLDSQDTCLDSDLTSNEIHNFLIEKPVWRLTMYNFLDIPKTILRDNMFREEAFRILSIMRKDTTVHYGRTQ